MAGLPAKSVGYESVGNYISNIRPIVRVELDNKVTKSDFLDILDILDRYCKHNKIEIPFDDFKSVDDLFAFIKDFRKDRGYAKAEGIQHYNRYRKQLVFNDPLIDRANNMIFTLWIGPLIAMEGKINQKVFDHCAYYIARLYSNATSTMYGYVEDWADDRFMETLDEHYYEPGTEEYQSELEMQQSVKYFYTKVFEFAKKKEVTFSKSEWKKLSSDERKLVKLASNICLGAESHQVTEIVEVDVDMECYETLWETDENGDDQKDEEMAKAYAVDEFFCGQFVPCLWEEDWISENYLQWVNDSSNNGYWDLYMKSEIRVTKNRVTIPNKKIRDYVVGKTETFFDFNDLTQKMYERIFGRNYQSYWCSDDFREQLSGMA